MMPLVVTQGDLAIALLGAIATVIFLMRSPRSQLKRLPFSGIFVLGLVYWLVGWFLAIFDSAGWVWLVVAGAAAAIAYVPSKLLGRVGGGAIALCGIAVIVAVVRWELRLRWVAIAFATLTAWTWAVGGAKFRMQSAGMARWFIQWMLIGIGWEGLWLGWLIDRFVAPDFGNLVVKYWVW